MIHQCEKCGIYTAGDFYKIYPKPDTPNTKSKIMCPECGKKYLNEKITDEIENHFKRHNGIVANDSYGINYINLDNGAHIEYNKYYKNFEEKLLPYFTGLRSWDDYTE